MSLLIHRHGLIKPPAPITGLVGFSARTTGTNTAGLITANWTADWDSGSVFNTTGGIFTAPVSGLYHFATNGFVPGGGATGSDANFEVYVNGVPQSGRATYFAQSSSGNLNAGCNKNEGVLNLTAGDTLRLYFNRSNADVYFSVYKIPYTTGFQATRSGGSGSSGSGYITTFSGNEWDSTSGFNLTTGTWTVPTTGAYYLYGQAFHWTNSGAAGWQVYKNGAALVGIGTMLNEFSGGLKAGTDAFGYVGNFTAGDTIRYWYITRTKGLMNVGAQLLTGFATSAFGAYNYTSTDGSGNLGGWTEEVDFAGDFNSATGVYTVPSDGKYFIGGKTHGVTGGSGTQASSFYKNGTLTHQGKAYQQTTIFRSVSASGMLLDLLSGDQITMRVSGGAIAADTNFFGYRIAA